ncbi:unnamed protein product [Prorocentrum cordatum]|uniref:Uncharacterized protein n=1 Tax=Prorocentrum cordatum TaxID=2364126 RepID=A0ABN9SVH1_9DINO|nr:unnamed protein product [Polarella glacialis]
MRGSCALRRGPSRPSARAATSWALRAVPTSPCSSDAQVGCRWRACSGTAAQQGVSLPCAPMGAGGLLPPRRRPSFIDDNVNLRDDWVARGGVFVHHVSTGQSLWQLHRLGVLPARSPPGPPCRQGVQAEWAQAWWAGTWWWCRRLASLPQASSGSDAEEVEFAELPHLGYRCFVPPSSLRAPGPGPPGGRPPVREPPAAASRCGWRGAQEHRADAAAQVVVFQ